MNAGGVTWAAPTCAASSVRSCCSGGALETPENGEAEADLPDREERSSGNVAIIRFFSVLPVALEVLQN